ncbi:methyl-accepting chemotaxis protein [Rhizobium paknamense]|uniref:Methyl-accepting chemotaxis protein n=2 Tax=Rhizobium paknamense TaxID=1206817 RepID=A0ABU0ID72_9HYPH|nr:methyl-accepting chemotaxis protein [Rhizobium paknamense]
MMRLSIGTVLSGLFCLLVMIAAGQGLYGVHSLTDIRQGTENIQTVRVTALTTLGQMNADLGDVRIAQAHMLQSSGETRAQFAKAYDEAVRKVEEDKKLYETVLVDAEDRALFRQFDDLWKSSMAFWAKVVALENAGRSEEALALFIGEGLTVYNKAGDTIQAAVDDIKDNVTQEGKDNIDTIGFTQQVTYFALGISIILALVAMAVSFLHIVRPISAMTRAMHGLAEGDTSVSVPGNGRKDELGAMAAALQVFKDGILRNRALEADAARQREEAEAEKIRVQREADAAAQKKLQDATAGLASALKRLAAGDLSFELTEPFSEEFEALRVDLNSAVTQLGDVIASVADSAGTIDSGSREVSRSAEDLARRTEQQAASLEETAAALDEITVNVSNAAKRVEEARSVAREANQSAVRSGEVVSHAIETIQRIENSSNQISNIIGVIDEIAFQTNLLALNAGVEAARAGEAGRGFAVVATEVRELAQRSAKAAKEIKQLIGNSTQEVESGVQAVRQTGEALKVIESHVQSINDLMDAITTSSREQSTGLSEVNTAVNQMDQVTQQNSAMVEETSVASSSLANESNRLMQLVSRFTIRERRSSYSKAA